MVASASKPKVSRLLVANRGEIACRIIRTCRTLGITPLAVYSEADANALHVRLADEALCIGPGEAPASYLNIEQVLSAARKLQADAIHPGYGFLSEHAGFAEQVSAAGICFIGPSADAMRSVGDKLSAKRLAATAKVPMAPSFEVDMSSPTAAEALERFVASVGFPLMVKAAGGGGGRGMRKVYKASDLQESIKSASREAERFFKNPTVFCERLIEHARHIEVQIIADSEGNVVALSDRDCTMQRKHQKVIEEAPAPQLPALVRDSLHQAAVRLMASAHYVNAGTVEFLLDKNGGFYFLEVNSRLQVEHPVTEQVLGIDLVALQIQVARGASLTTLLPAIQTPVGHAIEVRLCAEMPHDDFAPSTGKLRRIRIESEVSEVPRPGCSLRVDSGFEAGDEVSHFYDSLLAKIIVHAPTRAEAIAYLRETLSGTFIEGVHTNREFVSLLLNEATFLAVTHDIQTSTQVAFDDSPLSEVLAATALFAAEALSSSSHDSLLPEDPWLRLKGFRLSASRQLDEPSSTRSFSSTKGFATLRFCCAPENSAGACSLVVYRDNDQPPVSCRVRLTHGPSDLLNVHVSVDTQEPTLFVLGKEAPRLSALGEPVWVHSVARSFSLTRLLPKLRHHSAETKVGAGEIKSHLPGKILEVKVLPGDTVSIGDVLMVLESMKMEHRIEAPINGKVTSVSVLANQAVETGRVLVVLDVE